MINLLPSQYKKELSQEGNWRLILILGILVLIFLVSTILILFSVKTYILGQAKSVEVLADLEEKQFKTSEIQDLREKIILANQNLLKLNSFYQAQINSAEILEKIAETLPSGIYLTAISWSKSTSQISLSGYSPAREILLEFKENLEAKKEFTEIYFPPSNWIEPADIDFNVTFKFTSP